ncbi:unnamed protein product, partial [Mesorhabditis belari]|uniref:Uncharacterized protein n=1 Tax=Mesorhabditis belari TaxID=2138241 RepID=A0AAF3JAI8_9BILA
MDYWLINRFPTTRALSFLFIFPLQILSITVCPKSDHLKLIQKEKHCPDFKDEANKSYCCPSKVSMGSYFCCTLEDIEKIEAEESSRQWRLFITNYLAVIILTSLASVCLIIIITSILCKKIKRCPLYRDQNVIANTMTTTVSMYRPVDTIPPKIYEAPPPYDLAFSDRTQNDWNCLVENEVNRDRRTPPQTQ